MATPIGGGGFFFPEREMERQRVCSLFYQSILDICLSAQSSKIPAQTAASATVVTAAALLLSRLGGIVAGGFRRRRPLPVAVAAAGADDLRGEVVHRVGG